ncbi:4Fe-4S binding protein [Methanothermococcus okinawensis]|uniref:4Fe-4S ferredoxin iron-sulfur binding domain-containing protein n=1 Tax=Methanothermococcus okinawensis (strain DSM 14208 / JCM 11175 / IH1) TaxID=647113 RepID=F8AJJ7_METOI|nr:4Fe-4S binding protein [Methanothermococcus okinawensis]AEH07183.1 4Fe-4S ferredoxin iron-sulfur binding domain-containing protein [Methanothermococcus okinawensis IH1]
MIITDINKCRGIEKCETCPFKEISKCMEVCPTNAIILIDNKAFSCITCGTCARECPNDAIKKNEFGGYYVDRRRCNGCGTCEKVCPINIIKMKKVEKTVKNGKRAFVYPDGICIMCGLCVEVCPYDARMYFDPKDLKDKKNRALAERYLDIFNKGGIKEIGSVEQLKGKNEEGKKEKSKLSKPKTDRSGVRVSINIDREKCEECGKCIYLCPKNTILEKENVDGCTRCNICGDVCPKDAINCGEVKNEKCILCGNCIEKCPKDALQISNFKVVKIKEDKKTIPLKHCINCGLCADNCPAGALKIEDNKVLYDPSSCKLCNTCVNICPQGVRINKGKFIDGGCVLCGICENNCPNKAISIKEIKKFDVIRDDNCIGCGTCSNVCPNDAITVKIIKFKNEICKSIKREVIFNENCVMCENCAIHCPRDVIPNITGYKKIVDKNNSFIRTDFDFCVQCGLCNKICPNNAVDKGKFDLDKCEFCSACANICPTHAITIYRTWIEK